jgi:hypothetical protein
MTLLKLALACAYALPLLIFAQPGAQKMDFGRGEGQFMVGDMAPDFELKRLHSSETVKLSSFRGKKPVALIFGSYT